MIAPIFNQVPVLKQPLVSPSAAAAVTARPSVSPQAADAVQFAGIHPSAALGVEVKVAGTQAIPMATKRLWFYLRDSQQLDRRTYQTNFPLHLVRDPENAHDPHAIALYAENKSGKRLRVGYVPRELAQHVAPLMDAGHQFASTLVYMRPYRKDNQFFHSMVTRLEYTAKPGRAPNKRVMEKLQKAFHNVRELQSFERVLTLLPEEINVHPLPDGNKLLERVDHEQGTRSYYRRGHLLADFRLNPENKPKVAFVRKGLAESIRVEIRKILGLQPPASAPVESDAASKAPRTKTTKK